MAWCGVREQHGSTGVQCNGMVTNTGIWAALSTASGAVVHRLPAWHHKATGVQSNRNFWQH